MQNCTHLQTFNNTHSGFASAVFAVSVRLLSVTLVDCIQTAKDIVKLLSRPGSPIILVFLTPSAGTQFQGTQIQGVGGKILRCSTEIAVHLGNATRQARGYLWNINRKS